MNTKSLLSELIATEIDGLREGTTVIQAEPKNRSTRDILTRIQSPKRTASRGISNAVGERDTVVTSSPGGGIIGARPPKLNSKSRGAEAVDERRKEVRPPIGKSDRVKPPIPNSSPWNLSNSKSAVTELAPGSGAQESGVQPRKRISRQLDSVNTVVESDLFTHSNGITGQAELWLKEVGLWLKQAGLRLKEVWLWLKQAGLRLKDDGRLLEVGLRLKEVGLRLKEVGLWCINITLQKVRKIRLQPRTWVLLGASLAGIVGLNLLLSSDTEDESISKQISSTQVIEDLGTIKELTSEVQDNPNDAKPRLHLGHVLFASGERNRALQSYEKALELDSGITDQMLVGNLVGSFGTQSESRAAQLIARHNLTAAEGDLRNLLDHKRRSVRAKALQTLEKMGKETRDDQYTFYVRDLRQNSCGIRRNAVKSLGRLGDKRAIAALQVAEEKDLQETPWYQFPCLSEVAEAAIDKIRTKQ